ncbi:hypothetical protein [Flagellimonas myxillae]|uniref:hypothetical protein n=1 Tax=Flagellimonas myxillae TaxID=2942214 RepID=UPI00201EDC66|nr:hypothetical protein [Muricauda myxillae]MCL6266084.1 hypothetical protein [Muricauda myxillae]
MSDNKPGRSTAIISYFTIIGGLIAITRNMEPKHDFARFHARQAFGIHLIYHSVATYLNLSEIENLVAWGTLWGVYLVSILIGLTGAIANKERFLPLLGSHFQKWFTFIP